MPFDRATPAACRPAVSRFLTAMMVAACASGCSTVPIDTMHNDRLADASSVTATRAAETIAPADLRDDFFFGIAMSGGGSRAANFSAQVMLELEAIGLLDHATAISAVSGSALPAAYYGLYGQGKDSQRWNADQIHQRMARNFEAEWLWRWLLPQNIVRYWFTNFSRSDIMVTVLDNDLFDGQKFCEMGQGFPRILLNSTSLTRGERFVFSEENFKRFHSRIDSYPVASAVMASSAFPGAFHDVTLRDYAHEDDPPASDGSKPPPLYRHVIDGGPSDNLGTTTLLDMLAALNNERPGARPIDCFLLVVDAYPYSVTSDQTTQADTRSPVDFFFDTNVAKASDALLSARRVDLLARLGIAAGDLVGADHEAEPFREGVNVARTPTAPATCTVWYLGLPRLLSNRFQHLANGNDDVGYRHFATVVNSIPTRYQLTAKVDGASIEAKDLQNDLIRAAQDLIWRDRDADDVPLAERMCRWFSERHVNSLNCTHTH